MEARRALFGVVMVLVLAYSSCNTCTNNSHVVTTFKELISDGGASEFKGSLKALNYSELLVTNGYLYVGARNYVFMIDINDFSELKAGNYSSTKSDAQRCMLRNPKEECFNFIRVLQPFEGRLFVCGTNSYKPICMWKNLTDLSTAKQRDDKGNVFPRQVDGVGLAPYSPKFHSTGIISEYGRYYAGTMRDGAARDSTIFSFDFKARRRILETSRGNRKWLSDSEFVKSFSLGSYVYFFFREAAVENGCTKTRFSRVARICKGDYGGNEYFLKKNFVTYNKARIVCQTKGQYPAYFDEIQDVFWDESSSVFYAIFTTQPNGVDGSAICAFTIQDIERVFNGNYKYYDKVTRNWVSRANQHHFENCSVKASSQEQGLPESYKKRLVPEGMMATRIMTGAALDDTKKYQLMNEIVYPRSTTAQYIEHGLRFSTVAVDHVVNRIVMYVGTDKGSVIKLFKPIGHNESCILEEIKISDNQDSPITKMHLDSQRVYLYVATNNKLVRVKLSRCERHKNKESCIQANDPYCGWSSGRCSSWKNRDRNSGWEQSLNRCPSAKPVWSEWSKWKVCTQENNNVCQCRRRTCLNTCNSSDCPGSAIDLKQCTVDKYHWTTEANWLNQGVIHGNWTPWTEWTPCPVTLGVGVKRRLRMCMNPPPSNGGRRCHGDSVEYMECSVEQPLKEKKQVIWTEAMGVLGQENTAVRVMYTCSVQGHNLTNMTLNLTKIDKIDCTEHKQICKIPPTVPPGVWSSWAEWSKCKVVGMQHRTRDCKDVDKPCVGDKKQERQCYPVTIKPTTPSIPTPGLTTPKETDFDPSWNTWSKCSCDLPFKIMVGDDNKEEMGLMHRSRRCRGMPECPIEQVQYDPCKCDSDSKSFAKTYEGTNTVSTKTGYRIGDVIGAAIVTGVLVLVLCAVMAYIVIRRRKNFDVSKAFEKSIQEPSNESKYERTNGLDNQSNSSKDRNSSAKLQPVVVEANSSRSLKDVFKKHKKHSPESV
ncbi:semaphorin-5A-like [Actinia tenebrosa]|uniref:Semaphorin-2A n=1 Tax=Actinia tenebrosa TaxID=6105 RepID=A0A6P8HL69_ACTTE|nr:semaphorin-5A-like [Actinia tenebrosa]